MNTDKILLEELNIDTLYNNDEVTYEVPIYQRNYAWEEDQIKTLVQDVYDAFKKKTQKAPYYIGTLVTFDKGDGVYEVIDGQQRLTTIYLILYALGIPFKSKLTYRSRKKSKDTLKYITELDKVENVDTGIQNGYGYSQKAIQDIVPPTEADGFCKYFTNKVHILHYIVPKDVDLNHYFEVMNSRGEQLEKHEIVKANLCSELNPDEMEKFSRIWEACSLMNVYVQQKLSDTSIFGAHLNECPNKDFDALPSSQTKDKKKTSIKNLMTGCIENLTEDKDNDKNDTFQPIIDFPNFLLIVLKITRMMDKKEDFEPTDFILDDKELINEFNKASKNNNKDFVKKFAVNLLKAKFLLDNYIVHHTNNEDSFGENPWQLQQYVIENNNRYAKNVSNDNKIQEELVQLLSMFEVSFTAKQRKNYLFYCLMHLFSDTNLKQYLDFIRRLAHKYFMDIYLNPDNLSESNNRPKPNSFDNSILKGKDVNLEISNKNPDFPSIYGNGEQVSKGIQLYIFNYTDYKLWSKYASELRGKNYKKGSPERNRFFNSLGCSDFELELFDNFYFSRTRKSLEHFYPQAKVSNEKGLSQANINCFGNFAMIGTDANSSGSNWDPKTKLNHYSDKKQNQVSVASLKFKIMMQICDDNYKKQLRNEINRPSGMEWNFDDIVTHQKNMLSILMQG